MTINSLSTQPLTTSEGIFYTSSSSRFNVLITKEIRMISPYVLCLSVYAIRQLINRKVYSGFNRELNKPSPVERIANDHQYSGLPGVTNPYWSVYAIHQLSNEDPT